METTVRMLLLVTLLSASAANAQTGREYFNELRDANALTHYGDEYVCFHDEDTGGFAVISTCRNIEKRSIANHEKPMPLKAGEDCLTVETYFKGVSSGRQIFEKAEKDSDITWTLEFKEPLNGKMVYLINWTTGRYRLQVYAIDYSKTLPAEETTGKCELIHPWAAIPK